MMPNAAVFIIGCLAVLSLHPGCAAEASDPPVRMTLASVTLTNDSSYSIVFVVTNGGDQPVALQSCGASFWPTNTPMPLGMFGQCEVPPGTNCTMTVSFGPYIPGPYWWRYAVFKPSSAAQKVELAASRLKANVLGKGNYNPVWVSDLWSPGYEITSPTVPQLPGWRKPQQPFPLATNWLSLFSPRTIENKKPAHSPEVEWLTDPFDSEKESPQSGSTTNSESRLR